MTSDIVIFDTEFTAWKGSMERHWSEPWEEREIVQIAAIRINPNSLEETVDHFDSIVKPSINPVLSDYFTNLTSITNEDLEARGVDFLQSARDFHEYTKDAILYSFGDDSSILNENIELYNLQDKISPFKGKNITIWVRENGINIAPLPDGRAFTSGTFAEAIGAPFKTDAHYALNDVLSIQAALKYLVQEKNYRNPFM